MATQTSNHGIDYVNVMNTNKIPFKLKLVRAYIRWLNRIAPNRAQKLVYKLFFTPKRGNLREDQLKTYEDAKNVHINIENHDIFVSLFKQPKVILLHGWGSSSYRFRKLMAIFRDKNIGYLAFDFPAHGQSSGKVNNVALSRDVILELLQKYPTIDAIVAHSFGGGVSHFVLEQTDQITKFVTVGSPSHFESVIHPFYDLLDVPHSLRKGLEDKIASILNRSTYSVDVSKLKYENVQRLVIHDEYDEMVPLSDATRLKGTDENIEFLITKGLGHRKIMLDKNILNKIIEFID